MNKKYNYQPRLNNQVQIDDSDVLKLAIKSPIVFDSKSARFVRECFENCFTKFYRGYFADRVSHVWIDE